MSEEYNPFTEDEDVEALKRSFAAAYLRFPTEPYAAARSIEPHPGRAAYMAHAWPFDKLVLDTMSVLQRTHGPISAIPSEDEFALQLYQDLLKVEDHDTKLKYYRLFGEVRGYIRKNADDAPRTVNFTQNVMAYPLAASAETWEAIATRQQDELLRQATVIEHVSAG